MIRLWSFLCRECERPWADTHQATARHGYACPFCGHLNYRNKRGNG